MDSGIILSEDSQFSVNVRKGNTKQYSGNQRLDELTASNESLEISRSLALGGSYCVVPLSDTNKRRDYSTS